MNIIVVGCGKIGTTIIASLVSEGHSVTVVDDDPEILSEISNVHDIMSVCGNAADYEVLQEAGVAKTELFVAVTGSDEMNMLSCFMAKRLGAQHTIARIRNPGYNATGLSFIRQELGLSLSINPERLAARELYNILKLPSATKVERFSGRNFEIIEIKLRDSSRFDGLTMREMREKFKTRVLVCTVQRGDEVYVPDGSFALKSGDRIAITATSDEIQKFLKDAGLLQKQARNVMILGGSRTAYYLAKMLLDTGNSVKILEQDEKSCQMLCDALPRAVVIHGDGAQQEVLMEEGLLSTDAFVALTGIDEENILLSIFAASKNVPKVISKVNRAELASMAEKLGLESVISPRAIVSDILVQYARALENSLGSNVETLYKLMDGKAEALEFNVKPNARLIGIPLKDLSTKPNILIAGIFRDRQTIIPAGDDMILAGDRVIVISAHRKLQDLSDILS